MHKYIQSLRGGYYTVMQETGARERQRIALARVPLQRTPIVILDEPTIGLGPITEQHLIEMVFDVLAGKTMIWITHHLAGMEKMDWIVFLDNGQIQMDGTHEELVEKEERYKRLHELDMGVQ